MRWIDVASLQASSMSSNALIHVPCEIHMIAILLIAAGLMLTVGPTANAQTNRGRGVDAPAEGVSGKLPEFEVATIRPVAAGGMHMQGLNVYPGGKVVIQGVTLEDLICIAFHLGYWQIAGGDQMSKDVYDVEAKAPETSQPDMFSTRHSRFGIEDEHLRQMLQALLIDRFQLKFHRETKTGTVYLLERNGKTLRLQPTKVASSSPYLSGNIAAVGGRGWMLDDTSMPQLAKHLSDYFMHTPVLDRTGLDGFFDFESKTIMTDADFQNPGFADTFLPFIQEIGLKLQSSKGPVERLVIDHEEPPSPN